MQVARIKIKEIEGVEVLREGMNGAYQLLVNMEGLENHQKGDFQIWWIGADGESVIKQAYVKVGREYVIGPDFIKRLPSIENDQYWPRRWSREFGKGRENAHKSFFKIMSTDDQYHLPLLYGQKTEPYKENCPKTITKLVIHPLNGFSFRVCLINKNWLEKASYEEFCNAMNDKSLFCKYGG